MLIPVWIKNKDGVPCIRQMRYVNADKDKNWETIEHLGFNDDSEFAQNYRFTLYEVELELEVYKDGTSKIIKVDGREVAD